MGLWGPQIRAESNLTRKHTLTTRTLWKPISKLFDVWFPVLLFRGVLVSFVFLLLWISRPFWVFFFLISKVSRVCEVREIIDLFERVLGISKKPRKSKTGWSERCASRPIWCLHVAFEKGENSTFWACFLGKKMIWGQPRRGENPGPLDGQNRQSPIASDFGSRTQIATLFAVLLYPNVENKSPIARFESQFRIARTLAIRIARF